MQVVLRTARVTWPTCGIRSLVWLVSGILSSPYVFASLDDVQRMSLPIGVTTYLTGPVKNKAVEFVNQITCGRHRIVHSTCA